VVPAGRLVPLLAGLVIASLPVPLDGADGFAAAL
jgi:hypothetical protein